MRDALGLGPIHEQGWAIVQGRLRELVADTVGVRRRDPAAIEKLVEGLMLGGFAIQSARSTRAGLLEACLDEIFGPAGLWPTPERATAGAPQR